MAEKDSSPTQKAGRFKDARGKSVTLLDPIALQLFRRYDVIPAKPLDDIADEIGFGVKRWRLYVGYVCWTLGILYCLVVIILKFVIGFRVVSLVGLAWFVNAAVIGVGVIFTWRGARRARLKRVLSVSLRHLRCPHCGYDLRMLPTDPEDGATVCPECGCAWRMDDAKEAGGNDNG